MARTLDKSINLDPETKMGKAGWSIAAGKGGWVTFPFILGTMATITLASAGWYANLTVYLIKIFNVKSVDAAQINNVVSGCTNLFPVVGAVLADSFLGPFPVIAISALLTFLGLVFLALSAFLRSGTFQPCHVIGSSSFCLKPSTLRFVLLYAGISLASIGTGCAKFTASTMGANQFDNPRDRKIFFSWFFVTLYMSLAIGGTAIVYIQDNIGWTVGYGVCVAASFIGLVIFVGGTSFYKHDKPQGSPFTFLARVVVAAVRKRKAVLSSRSEDYYRDHVEVTMDDATVPAKSFRFFNRAALVIEGDVASDGSIAKPWRLCSVQQVEDLKILFKIFPLWSTSLLLTTTVAIQTSFTILQALAMDRRLGQHFTIPAGSVLVLVLISTSIFLPIFDRVLNPTWQALTGQCPSTLQLIGVGHVINALSMSVSAIIEYNRLKMANQVHQQHDQGISTMSMSALWLFPQLILVGIGQAFSAPGQTALYYQEFPVLLRSTSTAMVALSIAISSYMATGLIGLVTRITKWLPDKLNDGRLDYLYWVAVVIGVINFGYYLICAKLYKYQNIEKQVIKSSSNPED